MPLTNQQLAEAAHRRGDLVTAKQLYDHILSTDADNADALYGLGTVAQQENNTDRALELLGRAAVMQPQAADVAFNHAVCLDQASDRDSAVSEGIRAAELAANDEPFSNIVCRLLLRLDQAPTVLQFKLKHQHQQTESHIIRAQAHGLLGEWDKAVSLLRVLNTAHSNDPKISRELSVAAARLRDYPLAIDSYQRYMSLISPGAQDYLRLSDLYLIARDVKNSAEQLDKAGVAGATGAEYFVLRARLSRLNGDDDEARVYSEKAIELQPGNGQAWTIIIESSDRDELPELINRIEPEARIENISDLNKILLHFALADAHQKLGQKREAFAYLDKANVLQKAVIRNKNANYSIEQSEYQAMSTIKHFPEICTQADVIREQPTLIFIVGMPRSGTTLVERILSQLEDVTAGRETETLGFLATQYQLDVNSGNLPLPSNMTPEQWTTIARRYFERTPAAQKYLTEKLPHNFNHVGMILSLFPEAKVIQMRRDPRDVCLSIYSHPFHDGHPYACDFDSLAHAYKLCSTLMDHWSQMAPDRVMDVSYEQLAANPASESRNIVQFCELEWNDRCLSFHNDSSASFTFSEKQVREAISAKRVGRWKQFEEELQDMISALERHGVL
ncbi:MAG: tetratricopeptide (TPR) repeat protein [Halieaceae bacterium]|jgi:tetratricopeptide (TPR) repeat protein